MSHDSIFKDYWDATWGPEIFEHTMIRKYRQLGEIDIRDKCREIAKERIKKHSYNLPKDASEELNKIYQRALKEFS